jgi:hypothetical protein
MLLQSMLTVEAMTEQTEIEEDEVMTGFEDVINLFAQHTQALIAAFIDGLDPDAVDRMKEFIAQLMDRDDHESIAAAAVDRIVAASLELASADASMKVKETVVGLALACMQELRDAGLQQVFV